MRNWADRLLMNVVARYLLRSFASTLVNGRYGASLIMAGDRGDLVCGLVDGAAAFVYDISGIPAVDGVTATSNPAECKADLVINSNVLEHVGFPRLLLQEIVKAVPPGGLVYLEVPRESPFGVARVSRRVGEAGIVALTRPVLARHVLRPASLYLMHEHINYFSERSLAALMRSGGCWVIGSGSYGWIPA